MGVTPENGKNAYPVIYLTTRIYNSRLIARLFFLRGIVRERVLRNQAKSAYASGIERTLKLVSALTRLATARGNDPCNHL
jgi:hypothetical protein